MVWESKHGNVLEEEARAWLYIFEYMDNNSFYCDLDKDEADAYRVAKKGNAKAAQWLLAMRSSCEYERVTTEHLVEP